MTEFATSTLPDGVGVVVPHGRVTLVSARHLREMITDLVASGTHRIVVDLGETTFLDSSGLGALIAGLKSARQAGGDLRIARPTAAVLTVFELTNLDKVLTPRPTVEDAFRE